MLPKTYYSIFQIPDDAVILDVGANIGSISLPLANSCPNGTVYTFEPTDFAFQN